MRRILVSGASIAGPAVAWWLARNGADVTIVERNDGVRDGGQTVDIRGASRTVVQRMGVEDAIVQRTTHEQALSFVDENDVTIAKFEADQFGGEGPVAEIEILRGELAKLLVAKCESNVSFRWNDQILKAEDIGDKVSVTFKNGETQDYDLLIIAEGIGSKTRNAIFEDEVTRRPFNLYTAYFTIPKGHGDGPVARWYNAPGGRGVIIRPDNFGTTRAALNLLAKPDGLEKQEQGEQKRIIRNKFADLGWETPRVLDGMDAAQDFYLEAIGQVRMPRWHKGRIVTVGDAAYCASPLSGMGTALALCGAYVLAGELSRSDDHTKAFAEYERIVRPYVKSAQNLPSFIPRLGQPKSNLGIAIQRLVIKLGTSPKLSWMTSKLFSPPADKIDLPDYGNADIADEIEVCSFSFRQRDCTYIDRGVGPALLLLHGTGTSRLVWISQIKSITAAGYRVIALDFPGHGNSDPFRPSDGLSTIDSLAEHSLALLNHLQIGSAVIAGVSMGGTVAIQAALSHPSRVSALILINSYATTTSREFIMFAAEWAKTLRSEDGPALFVDQTWPMAVNEAFRKSHYGEKTLDSWNALASKTNGESLARIVEGLAGFDAVERLRNLRIPALVIAGGDDPSIAFSQELATTLPTAELKEIPRARHYPMVDSTAEFNQVMIAFLKRVS